MRIRTSGRADGVRRRAALAVGLAAALTAAAALPAAAAPGRVERGGAAGERPAGEPTRSAAVRGDRLTAGQELAFGDSLASASGQHELAITAVGSGDSAGSYVDHTSGATLIWFSGRVPGAPGRLAVQTDGNVVAYDAQNRAGWSTGTAGADVSLVLQDDGNLVVYASSGGVLWFSGATPSDMYADEDYGATRLRVGHYLLSEDRRFRLVLQPDGNLVQYGPAGALWSTRTAGGTEFAVQPDGNLVVYAGTRPLWQSGTGAANPNGYEVGYDLILQRDANLVLYRDLVTGDSEDFSPIWSSARGRIRAAPLG